MNIHVQKVGKRYNRQWVFKNITYTFERGMHYAITGHNGSGKSTLLRILSGLITPNTGTVQWTKKKKIISPDEVYLYISYAAPYMEVIEEMTINELFSFHFSQKKIIREHTIDQILNAIALPSDRLIRDYSSGMKQRVKLALAFYSKSDIILLDEPTTNLDQQGIQWFFTLLKEMTGGRTVILASNDEREYQAISRRINLETFKQSDITV